MTQLSDVIEKAIKPALAMLPARMRSREALVMLLTIGLQESLFKCRRQMGNGPARGFWQFERAGGTTGVIRHSASRSHAATVCALRGIEPPPPPMIQMSRPELDFIRAVYDGLEFDDVLAAAIARLLLWTDPKALPALNDADAAFDLYIRTWRPGAYSRGSVLERSYLRAKFGRYYAQAMQEISKCNA